MASAYPTSIDNLATTHTDNTSEIIHAATDNDQSDAINHIENELGILPKGVYADVKTRLDALEYLPLNNQNVNAYTLVIQDASRCVQMINAAASTITIPANATVAFKIGTVITILQGPAAGQVTVQGATGVVLKEVNNLFNTQGPAAIVSLYKVGVDTWIMTGATA
jgi:hypothetical protein